MNHKKLVLFAIPLLAILASIIYFTKTFNFIGAFIFYFSLSLIVTSIFFLFAKQESFRPWLKFAAIFVVIVVILIIISPTTGDSLRLVFGKKEVALFSAVIFSVMSIALIFAKSFHPDWKLWFIFPIAFMFGVVLVVIAGLIL